MLAGRATLPLSGVHCAQVPGRDPLKGALVPTLEQMKIRQRVLADFGDFALRCDSLDEVLHEACRLAADALGTDLAKIVEVVEVVEDGEEAVVKAGVGWRAGIVGKQRLPLSERTSET